jgi:hypothetical protein
VAGGLLLGAALAMWWSLYPDFGDAGGPAGDFAPTRWFVLVFAAAFSAAASALLVPDATARRHRFGAGLALALALLAAGETGVSGAFLVADGVGPSAGFWLQVIATLLAGAGVWATAPLLGPALRWSAIAGRRAGNDSIAGPLSIVSVVVAAFAAVISLTLGTVTRGTLECCSPFSLPETPAGPRLAWVALCIVIVVVGTSAALLRTPDLRAGLLGGLAVGLGAELAFTLADEENARAWVLAAAVVVLLVNAGVSAIRAAGLDPEGGRAPEPF